MRVYIKHHDEHYDYPEQMTILLTYLKAHGELRISGKTVEEYYYAFSTIRYSAGWMSIRDIDSPILEEFADYLADLDI